MEDKELKRITAKLRQIEKMLDQALELSSNDKVVDRLISVKEAAQMLNIWRTNSEMKYAAATFGHSRPNVPTNSHTSMS